MSGSWDGRKIGHGAKRYLSRRRWNAFRRRRAEARRAEIKRRVLEEGLVLNTRNVKALAEELGVSESAIWNDKKIIIAEAICPCCHQQIPLWDVTE